MASNNFFMAEIYATVLGHGSVRKRSDDTVAICECKFLHRKKVAMNHGNQLEREGEREREREREREKKQTRKDKRECGNERERERERERS